MAVAGVSLIELMAMHVLWAASQIKDRIKRGFFDFREAEWGDMSDSVQDLISRLLVVNPEVCAKRFFAGVGHRFTHPAPLPCSLVLNPSPPRRPSPPDRLH